MEPRLYYCSPEFSWCKSEEFILINFPATSLGDPPFVYDQVTGDFEEGTERTARGFTATSSLFLLNTDSH